MPQNLSGMEAQAQQLAVAAAAPPAYLSEDIHAEILVRLPAKSVLRFRSVCKAWRRITSEPRFLAAHARRRPAELLLYRYVDSTHRANRPIDYAVDIALDVLPVSGEVVGRRRPLVSYPKFVTARRSRSKRWYDSMPPHCFLLDSCNGVLLFRKAAGSYLLCNPVTRQWAELPQVAAPTEEYAFYFHQPSGEYRLLCSHTVYVFGHAPTTTWFVLSTGAAEPRVVDPHAANDLNPLSLRCTNTTPLALHGRVHWPPRRGTLGRGAAMEMVAFDTLSEKFHVMAGPPEDAAAPAAMMKLFVMDGLLAAVNFGNAAKRVDLWFLADYGAGRWERRYWLGAPWAWSMSYPSMMSMAAAADDQGNIVLGNHCSLYVYNVRTKAWTEVARRCDEVLMSRHVFRDSLVQHRGFQAQQFRQLLSFNIHAAK